jgi:hypothetical protein
MQKQLHRRFFANGDEEVMFDVECVMYDIFFESSQTFQEKLKAVSSCKELAF